MAGSLIGSEVLKIAGEINQLKAEGKKIANFTVGDFDPSYFPIPEALKLRTVSALQEGATNYPPSSGILPLRKAVADFYNREFSTKVQSSQVLVAGGARPLIYVTFVALVSPGEKVVYPAPSWNNNHYCHLAGAVGVPLNCSADNGFLPTVEQIAPHLSDARLLCLNSPLNPTGTVFDEKVLKQICDLVVEENERRKKTAASPLYVMFDQIYWKLLLLGAKHFNPVSLNPKIEPYTVFIDGVSKYFCGTGLRVGWAVLPENLVGTFSAVLGHIGAWAPKAEQIATADFLSQPAQIEEFISSTIQKIEARAAKLFDGISALKQKGLPVDVIRPQGGIYVSVRLGRDGAKKLFATNEEARQALLRDAGIAVVPFQAFALKEDSGWFRMSVGAVSLDDVDYSLRALEKFLVEKFS